METVREVLTRWNLLDDEREAWVLSNYVPCQECNHPYFEGNILDAPWQDVRDAVTNCNTRSSWAPLDEVVDILNLVEDIDNPPRRVAPLLERPLPVLEGDHTFAETLDGEWLDDVLEKAIFEQLQTRKDDVRRWYQESYEAVSPDEDMVYVYIEDTRLNESPQVKAWALLHRCIYTDEYNHYLVIPRETLDDPKKPSDYFVAVYMDDVKAVDDEEVFETLGVLLKEMNFDAALKAARALKN